MRVWLLVAVSCLAMVTAEEEMHSANGTIDTDQPPSRRESFVNLVLLEVRKSVVSPRNRKVKVLMFHLLEHKPLWNITKWELGMNGESYIFMDDNPHQTKLEFLADLTHTQQITITARNEAMIMAVFLANIEMKDMRSRVARVGNKYDPWMSSMRVATGEMDEVSVGSKVCTKEESPCYYLKTQLPQEVPRCINVNYTDSNKGSVHYCDDIVTSFHEIPEVALSLEGSDLTVTANFSSGPLIDKVEVVAFDLKKPTETVSPKGFECQVKGEPRKLSHVCHQELTEDGFSDLEILVVALDSDGNVLESKMQKYQGDIETKKSNKAVIIGSVIAVLFGIALIAGIFVYLKGRQGKKRESSSTRAAKYERTSTTDTSNQEEA